MATEFTPDQIIAAGYEGRDVCVVAGPGSGKTTVLVERYRKLLTEHQFDPRRILAITFTEKAAANMKAKLAAQFRHDQSRLRELESAWVSTIHGFCSRLLRENAIAAGIDPRFSVLSPREAERMQWECMQSALDELIGNRRERALELIEALHSPRLANELLDAFDAMRSAGMTVAEVRKKPSPAVAPSMATDRIAAELRPLVEAWPFNMTANQRDEQARLLEWCLDFESAGEKDFTLFCQLMERLGLNLTKIPRKVWDVFKEFRLEVDRTHVAAIDRHAAPFREMIFDVLARFDEEYRNRKIAGSRVDFNDLERHAIALLKNNADVRRKVHTQFRQIMLDEFQDINGQQAELISLIRSDDSFFGVGDVNQSIYGFRYARPEIFREYRDDVAARAGQSVSLLHNFRSRPAVLSCVREVLAGRDGIEDRELIAGRTFAGKDEPSIEILKILDAGNDKEAASEREAAWIAHRILTLRGTLQLGEPGEMRSAEFGDFAVLCRSGESMQPVLGAFDRAGIPYVCGRRQSFLLSREGRDIAALLSVIANPRDSVSLAGLLRGPFVGIGDEALLRLRLSAGSLTSGLNKFAYSLNTEGIAEPDAAKLAAFCRNLERWRRDQPIVPLDILLSRALSDCVLDWSPDTGPGANIESFLQLARSSAGKASLPAFLDEIESLARADGTEGELSDEDQGDRVQVMTAHAAKGLEFKVTIVAAMDTGTRRETGPVTFTQEQGLGVKWRDPAVRNDKQGLKDSWAEENKKISADREKAEENRLLYVAMTRAEEHLILSYSCGKQRPSNWAKLVDDYFQLNQATSSPDSRVEERSGFAASILVTDSDPPSSVHAGFRAAASHALIVPKPAIEDRHETAVTATSLAVFGSCPRKYYIQRSLGWNSGRFRRFDPDEIKSDDAETAETGEDADDLPAARIGSAVHELLAGQTPETDSEEARQLANVFLQSDLGRRAAASEKSEREWEFIAEIDGAIVRGAIDLWFREKGELHLVDYKTDAIAADAVPDRARDYAPQLALYAMALERALGVRPKTAWLHFLRAGIAVEVSLDDATFAAAGSLIAGLRHAQNELRFDLHEGQHCLTCPFYRSLCPAGRHNEMNAAATS